LMQRWALRLPFYYGWVIVGCVMGSSMARQAAAVATLSVFLVPMTDEFGWSRTGISGAVSLGGFVGALVAPFIGPIFDRQGSRLSLVTCALIVAACTAALAGVESLLGFYLAFGLSRMLFSTPFDLGTSSAIAKWFVSGRARAMAATNTASGIGLASMPLIAALVIDGHGWRAGWIVLAVIVIVLGAIPQWFLLVRQPEDVGLAPDSATSSDGKTSGTRTSEDEVSFTRAQALRTPALWLLMLFTALIYPVQAGISLHQAPFLIERGISPAIAATIVSAFSISIALGSVLCGLVARRLTSRTVLFIGALSMTVATLLMGEVRDASLGYAVAVVFGLGLGGISTMLPVTLADYFGREHYGAIRSIALPVQVIGQASGPLLAGVLHDVSGDYSLGFIVFAVLSAAGALVALATVPPTGR
jgi:MFS transporter, OFA family, oxalate/formate antiporter